MVLLVLFILKRALICPNWQPPSGPLKGEERRTAREVLCCSWLVRKVRLASYATFSTRPKGKGGKDGSFSWEPAN